MSPAKPFIVYLGLDETTSGLIEGVWQVLEARDIPPFPGLPKLAPHITLSAFEAADIAKLGEALEDLEVSEALPVSFANLGLFDTPDGWTVFLAPVVTMALIHVHLQIHDLVSRHGQLTQRYYAPEQWSPHSTLALGVENAQLGQVAGVTTSLELPLSALADRIVVTERHTGVKRSRYDLKARS